MNSETIESILAGGDQVARTEFRSLAAIVEQLASCDYRCEAGPLVNNSAFLELCRLAAEQIEGAEERARWAREYDADRRARLSARLEEK